jgi:ankyrin repeat protein
MGAAHCGHRLYACFDDLMQTWISRDSFEADDTSRYETPETESIRLRTKWTNLNLADMAVPDRQGRTLLMHASTFGCLEALVVFAGRGANLNERDNRMQTPLMLAAAHGHLHVVVWLLAQELVQTRDRDAQGRSAFLVAATGGHLCVVQELLRRDSASLSDQDLNGRNAALLAALQGHASVVAWFMNHTCIDANARDKESQTILMIAAQKGDLGMLRVVCGHPRVHMDALDSAGHSALMLAATAGHVKGVAYLDDNGADLHLRNSSGRSVLLLAAWSNHLPMVQWIIGRGALVTEVDTHGTTSLMLAAQQGNIEMLQWMHTTLHADLTGVDKEGRTAWMQASHRGQLGAVMWFGAQSATCINQRDCHGCDVLMQALRGRRLGCYSVAQWIITNTQVCLDNTDKGGESTWDQLNWPDGPLFGSDCIPVPHAFAQCILLTHIPPMLSVEQWSPRLQLLLLDASAARFALKDCERRLPSLVQTYTHLPADLSQLVASYAPPNVRDAWRLGRHRVATDKLALRTPAYLKPSSA